MVYSFDTKSFINALRHFIARRGHPEQIRSDNEGNFVKGEKELREALQAWNQAQIHDYLLQHDVEWIFNPPAASPPLLKQQVLDDEGLIMLMCEVESIVNGGPITKVSDDPRDLNALTPNHLLLLRAGTAIPPGVFSKEDNYSCRRWRQVQYLSNIFWSHWTREYLPSLQQRQKWNKPQCNLAICYDESCYHLSSISFKYQLSRLFVSRYDLVSLLWLCYPVIFVFYTLSK